MANVVYMPPAQNDLGSALGQGISQQLIREIDKREKEEKAKRVTAMIDKIKQAPDRRTALETAALVTTNMAQDVQDVNAVYGLVDKFHPIRDETPHPVQVVTPGNKKGTRYAKSADLTKLNTPQGVEELFGPGVALQGAEQEYDFFYPDATGRGPTAAGRGPLANRPEGALTKEELEFKMRQDADARAEQRLSLAEEREARLASATSRILARVSEADRNRTADNFRSDDSAGERLLIRGLGKQLPNGEFGFDDENKQALFNKRKAFFATLLEQDYIKRPAAQFRNISALAQKAVEAYPSDAEKPKPAVKGQPEEVKTVNGKTYYRYGKDWFDTKQ